MESLLNSMLLSALGGGFLWFYWLLGNAVAETYDLFFAVKPKKYKLGDIVQDNFIVHRIDTDGTVYWRHLLTEIPEDEPEEKIRIPMIRFEDIPFGEIKSESTNKTVSGVALNDPTRTGVLVLDKDVFSTSVLDDLEVQIAKVDEAHRNWEIEERRKSYCYYETEKEKMLIPKFSFEKDHQDLCTRVESMVMNNFQHEEYLECRHDFYKLLKLSNSWESRRQSLRELRRLEERGKMKEKELINSSRNWYLDR